MAKLKRTIQKVFGGNAGIEGNIAVFGSLKAGDPAYAKKTSNPLEDIQSLPGYGEGWSGATVRNNIAPLQDMNALQFLFSSQIAYLMQSGIPEWHKDQEYHEGSFCRVGNILYVATKDVPIENNKNEPAENTNYWRPYASISIGAERPSPVSKGHLHYDTVISR